MTDQETVSLDLLDPASVRRRARAVGIGAVIVGAAFGGVVGLLGGTLVGLIAAVVVGLPLVLLAYGESRRRSVLAGSVVSARALGTRQVDLRQVTELALLVTDARGNRSIGLLVTGGPNGRTVTVSLAMYSGTGGRELDLLALRRLADALAASGDPRGLVFSELLVAQLRAEAMGAAAADRPLHQLAATAPTGRLAHRLRPEAVTRFVASLG